MTTGRETPQEIKAEHGMTQQTEISLCNKCRGRYGITGYNQDCHNCEGWKGCLFWLWNNNEPNDTKRRAADCRYFALMGSHRYHTCRRGI